MSFRYPAGLITASSPVNANYPSGVWTPRQALPYLQNGVWGQDTNFNQTVLLLHGDGTNGAQNNTFLDSSTNNFTITRNGNTTQGTFSPFSLAAGQWSNYFAGTNGFLTTASNADFTFGTGDFTVEFWCYPISSTGPGGYAYLYAQGPNTTASLGIYFQSNTFRVWNGSAVITGTVSRTTNTWYHVAVSRSGTSMKLFVNGVQDGSTATNSSNITTGTTYGATLGRWVEISDANYFVGYLASVRVVKGTALYTSDFTPSTTPLTAVSGTELLTCQSNRFVDNSTNNFTITRNGDVRVTPFSPFAPTAAYSAGTNGGSGYFDGSGDYLSIASQSALALGTGDFQISYWIYPTVFSANEPHIMWVTAGDYPALFGNASGNIVLDRYASTTLATTTNAMTLNAWNYIVCSRVGTTLKIWINGSEGASITNSTNFGQSAIRIGNNGFTSDLDGYISDMRVVKGAGVTSVTIPTAPLTAISNTQLLLNFTNAGIFDNTGKNVLETVGNAQIDTTTKKYGTGSMEFDGTGDRLVFPSTPDLQLGTGNFTIEGWVYRADTNIRGVFQLSGTAGGLQANATTNLALGSDTGAVWRIYANNSGYNSAATWSINTWYHFALVRNSGTTTLYINGTSVISQADTVNYTGQNLCVGGFYDTTYLMNGYIDDLRITKGIARYTANFVPPIARFPNQ